MNERDLAYRQHNNFQILEILRQVVQRHPELRFGQLLMVLQVVESVNTEDERGNIEVSIKDIFNEESEITLKRLMMNILEGEAGI